MTRTKRRSIAIMVLFVIILIMFSSQCHGVLADDLLMTNYVDSCGTVCCGTESDDPNSGCCCLLIREPNYEYVQFVKQKFSIVTFEEQLDFMQFYYYIFKPPKV